jgi:hypothetical protein
MRKIKIFNNSNEYSIQEDINKWLAEKPNINIISVSGSSSSSQYGSRIFITYVLYDELADKEYDVLCHKEYSLLNS